MFKVPATLWALLNQEKEHEKMFEARALEKEDTEKKMQTFVCAESTPQVA
ncbi:hypothetical protein PF006_g31886, partial [Phytophthora fragariae]